MSLFAFTPEWDCSLVFIMTFGSESSNDLRGFKTNEVI